ncbi:MAG TPA: hypothetical protein VM425_15740 [Myxococcota bacterium]|nr:hypothetical protein [Myxococcota bacterium]
MLHGALTFSLLLTCLPMGAPSVISTLPVPGQDPSGALLGWMIKTGKLSRKVDTDRLDQLLRRGEALYLDGAERAAADLLGALLLDPSFWELANTQAHDNIRYDLAAALFRQGAIGRAREILVALVKRKPASAFSSPAFRKLVDLTLASGQFEQSLTLLGSVELGSDERDELAYLKGRALVNMGFLDQARAAFESVSRHSRFRAPALYLLGTIDLQRGDRDAATTRFCSIVHQPGSGRYTFLVSKNTLEVIDQAWLALARIRHEQGNYRRAADSYAMISPGSGAYPQARYEAAWSLYRLGRDQDCLRALTDRGAQNIDRVDWPAARLLSGYALLDNCLFIQARKKFDQVVELLGSVKSSGAASIPRAVFAAVPAERDEQKAMALPASVDGFVGRLLWAEDMLSKLASGMPLKSYPRPETATAADLRADLSQADGLLSRIADVRSRPGSGAARTALATLEAQALAARDNARVALEELQSAQGRRPLGEMRLVTDEQLPKTYMKNEHVELSRLAESARALRDKARKLADTALGTWWARATAKAAGWIHLAVLGRIDTALGKKQAMQTEVENLAQGRYPFSVYQELSEAGFIDAGDEYWPFDGEGWPDEVQ